MNSRLSFRWVITISLLFAGVVPLAVLSLPMLLQAYNASRDNALRELRLTARNAAERLQQEILLLITRTESLAHDSDLDFAARSIAFIDRADSLIQDFANTNPLVDEIWYFNLKREVVAVSPMELEMLLPADIIITTITDFTNKEERGEPIPPRFIACQTRKNTSAICLFHPVRGVFGGLVGTIALQISTDSLANFTKNSLAPTMQLRLFDPDGNLLTGSDESTEHQRFHFQEPIAAPFGQASPTLVFLEISEDQATRLGDVYTLMQQMSIFLTLVFAGVITLGYILAQWILRPMVTMTSLVDAYSQGKFATQAEPVPFTEFQQLMLTLADLGGRIQFHIQQAAEDATRESEMLKARAESELVALKSQMKPHFLFNALNNIVTMVDIAPQRAQSLLVKLSELYRLILAQTQTPLISLHDELTIVQHYLDLQSLRFGERLQYAITCQISRQSVKIPALLLQTLVENALKHGIEPWREGGRVEILLTTSQEGDPLPYLAQILNTGKPILKKNVEGSGLENTRRRLTLIDGVEHRFAIESTPEGTLVSFLFSGRATVNSL